MTGKLFKAVLTVAFVLFAFGVLAPASADAQATIYHVRVTVSHTLAPAWVATYCDNQGTACLQPLWNFPATGVALGANQTLVLTQTGVIPISPNASGGNFDTSEAIKPANPPTAGTTLRDCSPTDPCITKVEVDSTNDNIINFPAGTTYNGIADPLDNFNQDVGGTTHTEFIQYQAPVLDTATYTVRLGYADNVHGCPLPAGCQNPATLPPGTGLPTPFNGLLGTAVANVFLGAGTAFDGGAILFTAKTVNQGCTVTIGFWKTHGPIPKGNNENEWPVNNLTLGTVNYNALQLLSIFNQSVQGNGLVSLAHQLIGAKLNILSGANGASIAASIAAADALIGNRVVPPVGAGFLDPSVTSALNTALTNFNEGLTGPGHCTD